MTTRGLKLSIALAMLGGATAAFAHSGGPSPGYTGAPGEFNCRECHNTFGLNDGVGSITIDGAPDSYEPGQTYTLTVHVERPNRARWGFQMTALDGALDAAGTFQLVDASKTQLRTDDGKTYVEHKTAGTYAGTTGGASWSVKWTAPAAGTGPVDFYAAGNAANNNNQDTGDNIYTTFVESAENVVVTPFSDITSSSGFAAVLGGTGLAWSDFDADGELDVAIAGSDGVHLLRGSSAGLFEDVGEQLGIHVASPHSLAWGDFDRDGRPDLLVATPTGPTLLRNGDAGFDDVRAATALPSGEAATCVAWADFDGDGDLDAFVAGSSSTSLLRNDGGVFVDVGSSVGLGGLAGVTTAAWADVDGDGRLDVYVGTSAGGHVLVQSAEGSFEDAFITPASTDAAWSDVDGNGRLDLALATLTGLRVFTQSAAGSFEDATAALGLSSISATSIALADSDGDGRIDIVASGPSGVKLFRGGATGFADKTASAGIGSTAAGPSAWADVDGDGHLDLFVVGASGVRLWHNPAEAPTLTVTPTTSGSPAIGATVRFDAAGETQTRVVDGGGSAAQSPATAVFATTSPLPGVARATFAGGIGQQLQSSTGSSARIALVEPTSAPVIATVSVKTKDGVDKLLVDGSSLRTDVTVVEVNGAAMDLTKYPKKKRNGDGTSSRIAGTDAQFDALVPRGSRTLVTVFDPTTGVRSAPFAFTRP